MIKREMEDYVRRRHIEEGFEYVGTPHISKEGLFHTSGHLPYYADGMFPPMEMEGANYHLKAMNCPMHNLIFRSRGRSYRELPLRLFEFGSVYRNEKSGVVHGLTRVRGMTPGRLALLRHPRAGAGRDQAPARLLPRPVPRLRARRLLPRAVHPRRLQARQVRRLRRGVGESRPRSSRRSAAESGLELVPDPGGAAYYGPKISVQARDAIGRTWQMSTIQYDFNQPARLRARVPVAADGTRQQPVMIHSAKFGSIERFFGVLVEHYAGAFPPWLAPVQVAGDPDRRAAQRLPRTTSRRGCRPHGLRVEVDDSDDRMQKKIRNAQLQKVPFMMIAGDDDVEAGAVSFRYRDGHQDNGVPVDEAIARVAEAVASRVRSDGGRADELRQDGVGEPDELDRLWTPHRMAYIRGENKPADGTPGECPFCRIPALADEDGLVVHRGELRLRRAQPLPLQPRPPDGLPLPARRRLHRDSRDEEAAELARAHQAGDAR